MVRLRRSSLPKVTLVGTNLQSVMAASSDRFCANCSAFDWPQAATGLRRCARCRVLWYCGRPCQEEHWDKVHKRHCR